MGKVFLERGRGFVVIVVVFLCQVKMDYHSGKSRGFGFVNFKSPEVRQKVLSQVHYIQGRNCHVREPGSKVSTRPRLGLVFCICLLFNTVAVTMIICIWISISDIGNN